MDVEIQCNGYTYTITKLTFNNSGQINVTGDIEDAKYRDAEVVVGEGMNLMKFPRGIGSIFPNIKELILNNCDIDIISREDFADLKQVDALSLMGNLIADLPGDVFDDLQDLREMHLDDNKIEFIDTKLFDALPQLEVVNLEGNICIDQNWQDLNIPPGRDSMIQEIAGKCMDPMSQEQRWEKME
jgi:Leucine-rich repeat (LRR) protein